MRISHGLSLPRYRSFSVVAVVVGVVSLTVLVSAGPALAESPVWHLTSSSRPSILPTGGEGTVVLTASSVSALEINGASEKVMLKDTLPAGLEVVKNSEGEPEISSIAGLVGTAGPVACSDSTTVAGATVVACSFEGALAPYEAIEVRIRVNDTAAVSGVSNRMDVSGGGAPSVAASRPVTIGSGQTPFGVEQYEFTPENADGSPATQAGAHPFQLTTTLFLNSGPEIEVPEGFDQPHKVVPPAMVKDLRFKLPPGLIGNPDAIPQCTAAQFSPTGGGQNRCPTSTQIGVAQVTVYDRTIFALFTVATPVYNLVPARGEPARFGFIAVLFPIVIGTSIRAGGDYAVTANVLNITQEPIFLASQVTLWGDPGDPRHDPARGQGCLGLGRFEETCKPSKGTVTAPFLTMPSVCGDPLTEPLESSMTVDPWGDPSAVTEPSVYKWHDDSGTPLALDGCDKLGFEPSISVAPDGQAASTPTGLTVGLRVPQEEILTPKGLAQSDVKDTTVALPEGVQLSAASADGLLACSLEQISLQTAGSPVCPGGSKVGTVEIKTPLLPEPLEGAAYLAAQNANPFGSLVALYIVAEDPVAGVVVKFAGKVSPDPVTGQLVSTFENTPPLPFSELKLHFFGSARAPLATPAFCGSYTTRAVIRPSSGSAPAEPTSTFQIASGPNGTPCPGTSLPFDPSLTAGTTSIQAGGFSPFTMTMSRPDGNQNLTAIKLRMPPGLLGTLATVKLCKEEQANAGTCGPESLIGHTTVSVGVGGDPFTVTGGEVFITEGYEGAPYGLSIVNPAKAGPFDLGKVIVRAKIEVDPLTAALTITSDGSGPYKIPTILDGIPLQIQHVNVTIDRPGFTFNPTNCTPTAITGSLMSDRGAVQALSVPFQITNCAVLAFKPKLTAKASGKTSRAAGVSLSVKLTYPAGPYDANIAKVKVDLPKQLPSRLTTLQKACTAATFNANPANCPPASIVGHATATTPVMPVPLTGPAYFVSHGGEAFPDLIIVLQGYGATVHLIGTTFIDKAGITSSTFKTIPDVPVGTFELTLPQGKYSALAANGNLCTTKKLTMPTSFVAQNGAAIHTNTPIVPTGCAKHKKARKAREHRKGSTHGKR